LAVSLDGQARVDAGLHLIALFEALKGALALATAAALELLGPAPLQNLMADAVGLLHMDPRHGTLAVLARELDPSAVRMIAAGVLAYGLLRGIEAWGLWRARAWASWLGCASAAIYLPVDLYAIARHPGWVSATALAVNVIIVWVLGADLRRRQR
jgi:uncharacterized membrane protein (DUF2068 family)